MAAFNGFGRRAIDWFKELEADNSKAYFEATRETFETDVKAPMTALLEETAATVGGEVKLFRPYRDIRFAKDKSPYKKNFYGVVHSRPGSAAGYYAAISVKGLAAGTGYYEMAADQIERFRQAVDDEETGSELETILAELEEAGHRVWGEAVKSAPRGWPKDHPRIHLIRHKQIVVSRLMPPSDGLCGRAAIEHCFAMWRAAGPFTDWLDANVGPSEMPALERMIRADGRRG